MQLVTFSMRGNLNEFNQIDIITIEESQQFHLKRFDDCGFQTSWILARSGQCHAGLGRSIEDFQSQLMQHVRDDIREVEQKFKQPYATTRASEVGA